MLVAIKINTLSDQQYSQTLSNTFLHFQCLFVHVVEQAPVKNHLTLISEVAT